MKRHSGAKPRESHLGQGIFNPLIYLVRGQTHINRAEGHILVDGGREELVVVS
jgi:hypothetical protein